MPRIRVIETETLAKLTRQMFSERVTKKKASVSDLGRYVREHGYPDVEDYVIRRNKTIRALIDEYNQEPEEVMVIIRGSNYKALDCDELLRINNTKDKLKTALSQRDSFYANVARCAGDVYKENKKLIKQLESSRNRVAKLEEENEQLRKAVDKSRLLERDNATLLSMINNLVLPEVARELLIKEKLLIAVDDEPKLVNMENVERRTLDISTPISDFESDIVEDLWNELE